MTTAALYDGEITVAKLGTDYCVLAGNLAAIGVRGICASVATLIWPENCDFALVDETIAGCSARQAEADETVTPPEEDKKPEPIDFSAHPVKNEEQGGEILVPATGESVHGLDRAFRFAATFSVTLVVLLLLVIPLPLFFSSHIFGPKGFTGWVVVAFAWVFCGESAAACIEDVPDNQIRPSAIGATVIYPLLAYRKELGSVFSKIRREFNR